MFTDPFSGPGMGSFNLIFTIVPIMVLAVFAYVIGSMIYRAVATATSPVLTRNAQAIAKRTHVWGRAGGSHVHGGRARISYYITFELEDGQREEFEIPDNQFGLIIEGDIGSLITQGPTFRSFHRGPN